MADLETRKHAKAALKSITVNKDKGWIEKIKDFFLEIFIIVFAVSLSIWLHGWSEKKHQQEKVKEFLTDLRVDLKGDKEAIFKSKQQILGDKPESYYALSPTAVKLSKDNIKKSNIQINQNSISYLNSGNYEGFKSSGDIAHILNKPLKRKILKYYEQDIKSMGSGEKALYDLHQELLGLALNQDKSFAIQKAFMETSEKGVLRNYDKVVKTIDTILLEIDKEIKN